MLALCAMASLIFSTCDEIDLKDEARHLAAPLPPAGFSAQATGTAAIHLTWIDESTNETGFEIQRSASSGTGYVDVTTIDPGMEAWDDTGLTPDTSYWYRLRAVNSAGASDWTAEAGATTPAAVVHAKLVVEAGTNGTASAPDLSGTDVIQGISYLIAATPNTDYGFVEWTITSGSNYSIDNKKSANAHITLNGGDVTVKANFAPIWSYTPLATGTTSEDGLRSAIAISPVNDKPYVAYWSKSSGPSHAIKWTECSSGTWTTPTTIDTSSATADDVAIAVDSSGTPFVAYQRGDLDAVIQSWDGNNWVLETDRDAGSAGQSESWSARASIGFNSGRPFVASIYGPGMTSNYSELGIAGYSGSASYNQIYAPGSSDVIDGAMRVAGGNLHLIYGLYGNGKYKYTYGNSPSSLSTPQSLEVGGMGAYDVDLAVTDGGLRYFFWVDGVDMKLHCGSSNDGSSWSYEVITPDIGSQAKVWATLDKDGRPFCLYYSSKDFSYYLAWKTSSGWSTELVITAGSSAGDTGGAVAVDSNYQVHVTYYDSFASNLDLRYARRLPILP